MHDREQRSRIAIGGWEQRHGLEMRAHTHKIFNQPFVEFKRSIDLTSNAFQRNVCAPKNLEPLFALAPILNLLCASHGIPKNACRDAKTRHRQSSIACDSVKMHGPQLSSCCDYHGA